MTIHPGIGLADIHFGMTSREVLEIWGAPSREFTEENGNLTLCYHANGVGLRMELFEDFRLGWIMVSNPQARIFDQTVIGQPVAEVMPFLEEKIGETPSIDDYGICSSRTFQNAWVEVQEALGWVTEINFGVTFSPADEPLWPKSKTSL